MSQVRVLLMPSEMNVVKQAVSDLTGRWGAKLPSTAPLSLI